MAITFTKTGNGKILMENSISGEKFGLDGSSNVFPHPTDTEVILISDTSDRTREGFTVPVASVTTPSHTGRANLIKQLTEDFFFSPTAGGVKSGSVSVTTAGTTVTLGASELTIGRTTCVDSSLPFVLWLFVLHPLQARPRPN